MKQIYSQVIQFRGNHYDFGYLQGKELKGSLTVENRAKQWKLRKPRFRVTPEEVKEALSVYTPWIWEELIGMQDALEWPLEDVVMHFGGYRLELIKSGCSIYTTEHYMIRNYDFHPKTYEGRFVLYQPTDQGLATIGPSQRITGRMDGMNEKGLVIGYNFMNRRKPGNGFICNMIARMILESCGTVDDAVLMLKDMPHRHSYSYVLLDASSESVIVETTPRDVVIRRSEVCTNHFEILKHENRFHLEDSLQRMLTIQAETKSRLEAVEAFRLFNDSDRGVFSDQYKNWAGTIHTSAYFPQELSVWFALGGDQEPYKFDFKDWLQGNDVLNNRLYGEVNTDALFLHMDKNVR